MKIKIKDGQPVETQNYINLDIKEGDNVIVKDYSFSQYINREGMFCNQDPNHGKVAKVISTGNLQYNKFNLSDFEGVCIFICQMDLKLLYKDGTKVYISSKMVEKV